MVGSSRPRFDSSLGCTSCGSPPPPPDRTAYVIECACARYKLSFPSVASPPSIANLNAGVTGFPRNDGSHVLKSMNAADNPTLPVEQIKALAEIIRSVLGRKSDPDLPCQWQQNMLCILRLRPLSHRVTPPLDGATGKHRQPALRDLSYIQGKINRAKTREWQRCFPNSNHSVSLEMIICNVTSSNPPTETWIRVSAVKDYKNYVLNN
uniref:(California timema) hypothetical protein n=1 Tax=Timema californicum TaxID=61474 RepID=A0A7R9PBQ5_TIMCA|nr:unnamed protein product [Timema californicum]